MTPPARSVGRAGALLAAALAAVGCTAVREERSSTTVPELSGTTTLLPPPPTTSTTVAPLPEPGPEHVELEEIAEVDQPTAMAARAGDPALYVTERSGRVRRIEIEVTRRRTGSSTPPVTTQTFELERSPVLDIEEDVLSEGTEQGLLGIAFSTDGNRMYLAYTATDGTQHLDEYEMGADAPDADSRREILVVEDFAPNHNGGQLAFGPDGFLYWAMGDGGGGGDPRGTGQDPGDLLGSLLRIDPDVAPEQADDVPYAVPDGNPFAGGGGAPEVWAYGLRNPWRFSFDADTGDLWIADVGQGEVEEINFLPAGDDGTGAGRGANLQWPEMEGDRPFDGGSPPEGSTGPVFAYDHGGGGCAVTGGYVYRGSRIPELVGAYLFGDFCVGTVIALVERDGQIVDERALGLEVPSLSSFGEDADGELYALSLDGPVFRIVPAGS